jgi:hypothetical protein
MTANRILSFTGEQKIEDGLINAPAEIVASESIACRRVIPFCFIAHYSFSQETMLSLGCLP